MANSWHTQIFGIALFVLTLSLPGFADTFQLSAHLAGAGGASGSGYFTYTDDTHQLEYSVTYDGLSGPATVVDIHGPAAPGANAPSVVQTPVPDSPVSGTATLTSSQAAALLGSRLYVDVHTSSHPAGEIRGQIVKQ